MIPMRVPNGVPFRDWGSYYLLLTRSKEAQVAG